MHEPHDQIAAHEADIESLSDRAKRCRKLIILATLGADAGGLVLIALVLGLVRSSPALLVVALTTIVGGIALAGSSQGHTGSASDQHRRAGVAADGDYRTSQATDGRDGLKRAACEVWVNSTPNSGNNALVPQRRGPSEPVRATPIRKRSLARWRTCRALDHLVIHLTDDGDRRRNMLRIISGPELASHSADVLGYLAKLPELVPKDLNKNRGDDTHTISVVDC